MFGIKKLFGDYVQVRRDWAVCGAQDLRIRFHLTFSTPYRKWWWAVGRTTNI